MVGTRLSFFNSYDFPHAPAGVLFAKHRASLHKEHPTRAGEYFGKQTALLDREPPTVKRAM
jgi:hypothetical protein